MINIFQITKLPLNRIILAVMQFYKPMHAGSLLL